MGFGHVVIQQTLSTTGQAKKTKKNEKKYKKNNDLDG